MVVVVVGDDQPINYSFREWIVKSGDDVMWYIFIISFKFNENDKIIKKRKKENRTTADRVFCCSRRTFLPFACFQIDFFSLLFLAKILFSPFNFGFNFFIHERMLQFLVNFLFSFKKTTFSPCQSIIFVSKLISRPVQEKTNHLMNLKTTGLSLEIHKKKKNSHNFDLSSSFLFINYFPCHHTQSYPK